MAQAGGAGTVSQQVYIYDEQVLGEVVSQMAYGSIIRYSIGGIEYYELLSNEDFEVLEDYEYE
jgi:hypothetical protein